MTRLLLADYVLPCNGIKHLAYLETKGVSLSDTENLVNMSAVEVDVKYW